MNVSPFQNAESFLKADGVLYSFAETPWFMPVFCTASALILVGLVVKAYSIKR